MVHRQLVRGRNAAFLIAALTAATAAQGPVVPVADLERTVNRFFETAAQYEQTFRNLAVEETRLIEELDQSGRVKKRREIVADLVVYRTARNGDDSGATEYRDARVVDGKAVAQRGKRALDLITRAMTRGSVQEGRQALRLQSTRRRLYHRSNTSVDNARGVPVQLGRPGTGERP
jgi:hypothetical protein